MRTTAKRERVLLSLVISFVVAWGCYSLMWSCVGKPLVGSKKKSVAQTLNANRALPSNEATPNGTEQPGANDGQTTGTAQQPKAKEEASKSKPANTAADTKQVSTEKSRISAYTTLWKIVIFLIAALVFWGVYRISFEMVSPKADVEDEGPLKGMDLRKPTRSATPTTKTGPPSK
jgi:hypothetical protein